MYKNLMHSARNVQDHIHSAQNVKHILNSVQNSARNVSDLIDSIQNVKYYISMGQAAYSSITKDPYNELANNFEELVKTLNLMMVLANDEIYKSDYISRSNLFPQRILGRGDGYFRMDGTDAGP